jgi:hypothetical protein
LGYTGNQFVLPLDLSYEVDLWGRVRRSFRAAREQAQASAATYQNVLLSLQADVAQTYFMIRSIDSGPARRGETIELRKKTSRWSSPSTRRRRQRSWMWIRPKRNWLPLKPILWGWI